MSFWPVAVNSWELVFSTFFSSSRKVPSDGFSEPALVTKETFSEKLLPVVRIETAISAAGANANAQTKKMISPTNATPPIITHLRYFSSVGIRPFLSDLPDLLSFSFLSDLSISSDEND